MSSPNQPPAADPENSKVAEGRPHSADARHDRHTDASRGEVAVYAFGNVEASQSDNFFATLQNILIVAMHVNPVLIGLVFGIKTLWDSVTDPIMAWITDNARTRWGRRRPFILVGGVTRPLVLVAMLAFMPTGGHLATNQLMEAQKFVNEAVSAIKEAHRAAVQVSSQIDTASPADRARMLELVDGQLAALAEARGKLDGNLPTLRDDLLARQAEAQRSADEGAIARAAAKVANARKLVDGAEAARRTAIAAEFAARHVLDAAADPAGPLAGRTAAQAAAGTAFAQAGLAPLDILEFEQKPLPLPSRPKGMWEKTRDGIAAFNAPENSEQRTLIFYLIVAVLIFTVASTVQSVPYYALGIELSPSYNGRTQVVVYRGMINQVMGVINPWLPVICFSLFFTTALQGLFWIIVFFACIGIPATILMFVKTRERTDFTAHKRDDRPSFLASIVQIGRNPQFLRIAGLYCFIGLTNGVFQHVGFLLNVYWVMGSALSGAKLGAGVAMLAWGIGFFTYPLINWGCRRFQKHRMLQAAIVWMAIGTALKWWAMNPDHPEYQFILPFFFSVGIASVYSILPTLMADVTDLDELNHGVRREGMFGAVMAFIMKGLGTFTPILAGAVLVLAGFDPALEYEQASTTIFNMRLMYSLIPAGMLLLALLLLWRYPLTAARVADIKAELARRHAEG